MKVQACIDHAAARGVPTGGETHCALFYRDDEEYATGVTRFLAPAVRDGDPVAIAVPARKGPLLAARLEELGAPYEMLDMVQLGRNPARIIPEVERMLAVHDGRTLHYVGEPIWAGRTEEEIREATRHEALINLAWPEAPIRVLCPYDERALDPEVLAEAERTHPVVIRQGRRRRSPAYRGATAVLDDPDELRPAPPEAAAMPFGLEELARVRVVVAERARTCGLDPERSADLVLAVDELATNAIRHASGTGVLRVWDRGDRVICEIEDTGHIEDPLAGRRVPQAQSGGGVGLWLVNQLCDLVQARSSRRGTLVRVHMTVPG